MNHTRSALFSFALLAGSLYTTAHADTSGDERAVLSADARIALQERQPAGTDANNTDTLGNASDTLDRVLSTPELVLNFRVNGTHTFNADLDDADGSLSITRMGMSLGAALPLDGGTRLNFGISTETSLYNFDDTTLTNTDMTPLGDPVGQVAEIRLRSGIIGFGKDGFVWNLGGFVGFAGETDATFGDAFIIGVNGGASWQINSSLRLGFFASVRNSFDDEAVLWIALPTVDWTINDQWRFNTGLDGLLTLSYSPNDRYSFTLDTGFEQNQYRLADDSPVAEGTFTDARIPLAAGLRVTLSKTSFLRFRAGVYLWNEIEISDANDERVIETNTEPAGFLALDVSLDF